MVHKESLLYDTNHVIRISTVNLNQDWQMIEHRLKEIIKEQ